MNKEIVVQQLSTTKLKIQNNKIEAVFKSSDTKTGIRLYDGKSICISGGIGKIDENTLTNKAKDMLKFNIPYPLLPTKNAVKKLDLSNESHLSDKEFANTTEELLSKLTKNYPEFSFSEDIEINESSELLKNDCGTILEYKSKAANLSLVIKHKKSLNLMDAMVSNFSRSFNLDDAYAACTKSLDAFNNKVDIKDNEMMPVIFYYGGLESFFYQHLNGKLFGAGGSIFSDKVGQKLFSDKFSLNINRNPKDSFGRFFDGEGMTLEGDKICLIENGVIRMPYSSRKVAQQFGYKPTASASLVYDAVPDVSGEGIEIEGSGKSLNELLSGNRAVLVEMAAGGD